MIRNVFAVGSAAIADAVRLGKPYFRSKERGTAYGLLAAIVVLNLLGVYFNVLSTYWYKIAYNALQTKNAGVFWSSMFTYRFVHGFPFLVPGIVEIAAVAILAGVYAYYLQQMLQIRWRRWMTMHFVDDWLGRDAYYQIGLVPHAGTPLDNPDQRISDDLNSFVASNLNLGLSLLSNVVTLLSFSVVLWTIGPPLPVGGIVIHGFLFWVAVFYSLVGTVFTQLIGRKLVPLSFRQQQVEADFRFNLVRIRENSEQIALYRGERAETGGLTGRFAAVYENWWRIMKRTKLLNFFTIGFVQVAAIIPLVAAVPGYFAGVFTLGIVMQIVSIFGNVQGALSWFVNSYPDLVAWRATVQRLDGFERAVRDAHVRAESPALVTTTGGDTLRLDDVTVALPSGATLLEERGLAIERNGPVALEGRSGVGKSTLFRVIAGIWPYARGRMQRPAGTMMFLPQRPYVPIGTLKDAVAYPGRSEEIADTAVRGALETVGLGALAARLDQNDNWMLRLSGGEQQRLALARALVVAPDWLFLDEALSALDDDSAEALFAMIRARLPDAQIVSITHQEHVRALHRRRVTVAATRVDRHAAAS